jgi:hypothetical protein
MEVERNIQYEIKDEIKDNMTDVDPIRKMWSSSKKKHKNSPINNMRRDILREIDCMEQIKSQYKDNSNTYFLLEIQYNNFSIEELFMIAEYYNLDTGYVKNKYNISNDYETDISSESSNDSINEQKLDDVKTELIHSIIIYELDKNNFSRVYKRRKLWACLKEIKEDRYFSKYLHL